MNRSLVVLAGSLVFVLAGCPGPGTDDMNGPTSDMSMGGGDDGGGGGDDGGNTGPTLCQGAGCVGAPCSAATDCKEGTSATKVCWKDTLLNNPSYVLTPGGY